MENARQWLHLQLTTFRCCAGDSIKGATRHANAKAETATLAGGIVPRMPIVVASSRRRVVVCAYFGRKTAIAIVSSQAFDLTRFRHHRRAYDDFTGSQICLQSEARRGGFDSRYSRIAPAAAAMASEVIKNRPSKFTLALSRSLGDLSSSSPSALPSCIPGVIFQTHMRFYWPIYSAPSFFLLLPPMTRRIWACTAGSGRRSGQRTDRRAGQSGVCIGGAGAVEFRCKKNGEPRHSGRQDMRKGIQKISE